MEFPEVGVQCSVKDCKQLDFLPFTCTYCESIFCKEHSHVISHTCSKFVDNIVNDTHKKHSSSYHCSQESCIQTSPVKMPCTKCGLHFCLAHRYHGCLEISEEQKLKELEKWQAPREEFGRAKAAVDKQVTNILQKAKNVTVANKVQLMRLKGRAVGPNGIPIVDRCYFNVYPPITGTVKTAKGPKALFVTINWTVGRVIDSLADKFGLPNSTKKLLLFHHSNGLPISERMDVVLSELLRNGDLIDGQNVILEYSSAPVLDPSLYN